MYFKKVKNKIFDVELTAAEAKALDEKCRQTLAEYVRMNDLEIEALIIRHLRRATGWGDTRLRRFYDGIDSDIHKLAEHYEMELSETPWLCVQELKQEGFDIEQWHRENHPNERYIVK